VHRQRGEPKPLKIPATLFEGVIDEVIRIFRRPFEVLICVYVNAVLTTVLYFFAPAAIYDLFFSVKGMLFFPAVLSGWMLADVPATNELAPDRERMLACIGDERQLILLLRAKHLVLWLLITPVALTAAAIAGANSQRWSTTILIMVFVVTVPFASLGASCFIGVYWPYHPIALKERWAQRHQFKQMILRWGILVTAPYVLVPAFGWLSFLPAGIVWEIFRPPAHSPMTGLSILITLIVSMPLAFFVWDRGTRRAAKVVVKRQGVLTAYLNDPSLG
jgi:hypothetical protein